VVDRIQKAYDVVANVVATFNVFDVIGFITGVMLIHNSHEPIHSIISVSLFLVLACSKVARRSPWFWLGVVLVWTPRLVFRWYEHEDHVFFGVYWCAAIGLALWGNKKEEVLGKTARLLIGGSFALALFWKALVPQFYDGSLFHYKLLYDARFRETITQPIGQLSVQTASDNIQALRHVKDSSTHPTTVSIEFPERVTWIANSMTVWTLLIEGAVASLFLLPITPFTDRWRDPCLIFFMLSTYFIVPVLGFALVFTAMGIAQDQSKTGRIRLAYLLAMIFLFFSKSPFW